MALTPEEAKKRKKESQRKYEKKTSYAAINKYNKERGKLINFRLFTPQDDDILSQLDMQQSKAGYIKRLIREDMKKNKKFHALVVFCRLVTFLLSN